jgi:hypothetical protein
MINYLDIINLLNYIRNNISESIAYVLSQVKENILLGPNQ